MHKLHTITGGMGTNKAKNTTKDTTKTKTTTCYLIHRRRRDCYRHKRRYISTCNSSMYIVILSQQSGHLQGWTGTRSNDPDDMSLFSLSCLPVFFLHFLLYFYVITLTLLPNTYFPFYRVFPCSIKTSQRKGSVQRTVPLPLRMQPGLLTRFSLNGAP